MNDYLIALRDLTDWNQWSGYVAAISGLWTMYGFGHLAQGTSGLVGHLTRSAFWWSAALTWRLIYWDIVSVWMQKTSVWAPWNEAIGGTQINLIWNVSAVIGAYHALSALHLMLKMQHRESASWWAAPRFDKKCFRFCRRRDIDE